MYSPPHANSRVGHTKKQRCAKRKTGFFFAHINFDTFHTHCAKNNMQKTTFVVIRTTVRNWLVKQHVQTVHQPSKPLPLCKRERREEREIGLVGPAWENSSAYRRVVGTREKEEEENCRAPAERGPPLLPLLSLQLRYYCTYVHAYTSRTRRYYSVHSSPPLPIRSETLHFPLTISSLLRCRLLQTRRQMGAKYGGGGRGRWVRSRRGARRQIRRTRGGGRGSMSSGEEGDG